MIEEKEEEKTTIGIKDYRILIFILGIICILSIYGFRSKSFIRKV